MSIFTLSSLLLLFVLVVFAQGDVTPPNFHTMKIKELKGFLKDRGVQCEGCVEKSDFVKKCLDSVTVPLTQSAQRSQIPTEPIDQTWGGISDDVCKSVTTNMDICSQLRGVVESTIFQFSRQYKRDLSVQPAHLAATSLKQPYFPVGKMIIRETLDWILKEGTRNGDQIRKVYEPKLKPWLRDVALENTNPMFEALSSAKGRSRGEL